MIIKEMGGDSRSGAGFLMVLVCLVLSVSGANAQRITGQSAAEAFSKGDFSNAYEQYSTLVASFPRDPSYLYGAGLSLLRLQTKPEEAAGLLSRALAASSSVRSAPADTRFYLARALQQSGRFEEAVREYEKFAAEAGRREARDKGIALFIEECNNRAGMLAAALPKGDDPAIKTNLPQQRAELAGAGDPGVKTSEIQVSKPDTLPKHIDTLLSGALNLRVNIDAADTAAIRASDSLLILAGVPVPQSRTGQPVQAGLAGQTVQIGQPGQTMPVAQATTPRSDTAAAIKPVGDSVRNITNDPRSTVAGRDSVRSGIPVRSAAETPVRTAQLQVTDDTATRTVAVQQTVSRETVTSLFAIKEPPHYSRTNPVTVSTAFPPGLFYTVQLAVFRNPVDPAHFKRLYPVYGIKNSGSELTYYYSGLFRTMAEASKSLQSIRNEGFKDAFVTILMDGKVVSAERGAILEKEWGTRGLPEWAGVVHVAAVTPVPADTVPPTLLFRIEVLRTTKGDNKQLNEEISRVAGDRGFEIMNPAGGIYVYIVGKFLTFESASAYADLLRRNGYKEAKVAAYAGSREIPIETALKLFER